MAKWKYAEGLDRETLRELVSVIREAGEAIIWEQEGEELPVYSLADAKWCAKDFFRSLFCDHSVEERTNYIINDIGDLVGSVVSFTISSQIDHLDDDEDEE